MNSSPAISNKRNKSLDYLRGLMATAIMLYHYVYAITGTENSDTILGRLGIYGVSVFYILSGLTLYIVYKNSIQGVKSVIAFFVKRVFRIFPLLWLAITIKLIIFDTMPGWKTLFLNYSGLFGFVYLKSYLATGQWSIGNELVFYVFFPVFLLLSKRKPALFIGLVALSVIIGLYFAFYLLTAKDNLASQWVLYINPFNQLLLFAGGIFIGYTGQFFDAVKNQQLILVILGAGISGFAFYPVSGDQVNIVTGFNRLFFVSACYLICFGFYHQKKKLTGIPDAIFTLLGEASYSIYLLHPFVFSGMVILNTKFLNWPLIIIMVVSVVVTFLSSYIVYKKLELPFIALGKWLTRYLHLERQISTI